MADAERVGNNQLREGAGGVLLPDLWFQSGMVEVQVEGGSRLSGIGTNRRDVLKVLAAGGVALAGNLMGGGMVSAEGVSLKGRGIDPELVYARDEGPALFYAREVASSLNRDSLRPAKTKGAELGHYVMQISPDSIVLPRGGEIYSVCECGFRSNYWRGCCGSF